MKKTYFFVVLTIFALISCKSDFAKYLDRFETANYFFDAGVIRNKHYYNIEDGSYYTVPMLPRGLYLFFHENAAFPNITYQGAFYDDDQTFPAEGIVKIYEDKNNKTIYIESETKQFYKIDLNKTSRVAEKIMPIDFTPYTCIAEFKTNTGRYVSTRGGTVINSVLGIQSKEINKKYKVDYSTLVVNGITKVGIFENYYVGETVYSYFVFDFEKGTTYYFYDFDEYKNFCMNYDPYGGVYTFLETYYYLYNDRKKSSP